MRVNRDTGKDKEINDKCLLVNNAEDKLFHTKKCTGKPQRRACDITKMVELDGKLLKKLKLATVAMAAIKQGGNMSVRRVLVTGTDKQLMEFHLQVCGALNAIERREQTVFYTCMCEDWESAMNQAKIIGLEIKEL